MDEPERRVGVIVIRVWLERRATPPLRARITHTTDLGARAEVVTAAASVDEICAQVRAWLHDFLSVPGHAGPDRGRAT
jgi:hypothetical protein